MIFTGQRAPDIRRKLQMLDGAFGMSTSQLVDVSFMVFNNIELQHKQEDTKWNVTFLAAVLASQNASNLKRVKPPMGTEQCTYCKEEGF